MYINTLWNIEFTKSMKFLYIRMYIYNFILHNYVYALVFTYIHMYVTARFVIGNSNLCTFTFRSL